MVRETLVRWTAAGSAGGISVLYWDDAAATADINTNVQAFFTALRGALASTTSAVLDTEVRDRNTATGTLTGTDVIASPANIIGNGGSSAVPNAAQGLIRMGTGLVVGGRRLRGRIFIPGMHAGTVAANGEVTPAAQTQLNTAGDALSLGGDYHIWHRPVNGAGGQSSAVNSETAWNEFATQRRRRS